MSRFDAGISMQQAKDQARKLRFTMNTLNFASLPKAQSPPVVTLNCSMLKDGAGSSVVGSAPNDPAKLACLTDDLPENWDQDDFSPPKAKATKVRETVNLTSTPKKNTALSTQHSAPTPQPMYNTAAENTSDKKLEIAAQVVTKNKEQPAQRKEGGKENCEEKPERVHEEGCPKRKKRGWTLSPESHIILPRETPTKHKMFKYGGGSPGETGEVMGEGTLTTRFRLYRDPEAGCRVVTTAYCVGLDADDMETPLEFSGEGIKITLAGRGIRSVDIK